MCLLGGWRSALLPDRSALCFIDATGRIRHHWFGEGTTSDGVSATLPWLLLSLTALILDRCACQAARGFRGDLYWCRKSRRRSLRWHRPWSLHERRIRWDRVRTCTAERDIRPGVPRHTIRLVVKHEGGLLEVMLRGPLGALALAKLRDKIRANTSSAGRRIVSVLSNASMACSFPKRSRPGCAPAASPVSDMRSAFE